MNPFGARRHLRLGTPIGAGWDADPRLQGGEWETCGQREVIGPCTYRVLRNRRLRTVESYPWIKEVYEQTSGYVHLSEKHFCNAMSVSNETGILNMKITDIDAFVTENDYKEAVISFRKATDLVFDHVKGWVYTKNNPGKMDRRNEYLKRL